MRLTNKLLVFFIPILFITIAGLSSFSYYMSQQNLLRQEVRLLNIVNNQISKSKIEAKVNLLSRSGLKGVDSFESAYQQEVFVEFNTLKSNTNKSFHIIDKNTQTLIYSTNKDMNYQAFNQIDWQDLQEVSGTITLNNESFVYSGFHFVYWDWQVYVTESLTVISQPIETLRNISIIATICATVIGSILIWLVTKRIIINRVTLLKDATQQFSKTKKHISNPLSGRDELNDLAEAMRSMSIEIEDSIDKIEAANQAKTEFLATISHEIRTPLNGLIGSAKLLNNTNLDDTQDTYVQALIKSSQTLSAVINDVLDLSKIESGKLTLERTLIHPAELINSIEVVFLKSALDNNSQLTCESNIDNQLYLYSDVVRLRQILFNLVGNAIKFTSNGQINVHFSLTPRAVDTDLATHEFVASISDTGVGIEENRMDAVFESFTQSDNSTTRKYGGTGLGLTIVSKLVELLQGVIKVTSQINVGSTFVISIPITIEYGEDPYTEKQAESNLQYKENLLILLVEDNEINAMVAKDMLENYGHTIILANNGSEALTAINAQHFDVVLMDIHMPVMDGIEATKQIRAMSDPNISSIPIIGLTAEAFEARHQLFMAVGMQSIITKPIDEAAMLATIHQVVNKYA